MLWAWKRNFLQFHGPENTTAIASVDWLPLWVSLPEHSTVCDGFGRCSLGDGGGGADAGTVVLTHIQSFLKQQCSEHTIKQL